MNIDFSDCNDLFFSNEESANDRDNILHILDYSFHAGDQ